MGLVRCTSPLRIRLISYIDTVHEAGHRIEEDPHTDMVNDHSPSRTKSDNLHKPCSLKIGLVVRIRHLGYLRLETYQQSFGTSVPLFQLLSPICCQRIRVIGIPQK